MRRPACALSVPALAGVVLGLAASAASADPAAEVSPGTVSPGGSVTVSVSCDALDGVAAPATVDATSQAFEEGTVKLKRVAGNDEQAAGAAYSGTARIPPAENFEVDPDAVGSDSSWTVDGTCPAASGGEGKEWSATFTVAREGGGAGGGEDGKDGGVGEGGEGGAGGGDGTGGGGTGKDGGGGTAGDGDGTDGAGRSCTESHSGRNEPGWDGARSDSDKTDGDMSEPEKAEPDRGESGSHSGEGGSDSGESRPDSDESGSDAGGAGADSGGTGSDSGGTGADWDSAASEKAEPAWEETEFHSGGSDAHAQDCGGEAVHRGVQAGAGGAFTDSVPALVAGGVLIAGAFGGAVYRLRRKTPPTES
ncbi:hypothetical protein ACQEV2_35035 [Streptomyces sp. CA-251387]|uniref:hypothetical protein n=1 Tax=Streptomyces sp. CA-251387 TaxID=3240064 RepID=UPI003D8D517F